MAKPKIDRALVHHVAKLAALSIDEDEASSLAADLERIVAYVAELDAVDTEGVPPTANVRLGETQWRADEVLPGLSHDEALAAAPRTEHEGFAVPSFVENG